MNISRCRSMVLILIFNCLVMAVNYGGLRAAAPLLDKAEQNQPPSPSTDWTRPGLRIYTDKDGLPQNTVSGIVFDKKGYLWVGTHDGAATYNGQQWTIVDMPNKKSSNYVSAIMASGDGTLWFGTRGGGLSKLQGTNWTTYDKKDGLPSDSVNCLLETTTPQGKTLLWAGTENGLTVFDGGHWTIYNNSSGPAVNRVVSLLATKGADGAEIIWVGTRGGLARLENGSWTALYNTDTVLPDNNIRSLLETKDNRGGSIIWIGTNNGLVKFHHNRWTVYNTASGLPSNLVKSLLESVEPDGRKKLWIGTSDGLVSLENEQWKTFDITSGLPNTFINYLAKPADFDKNCALWIGTYAGIARLERGTWVTYTRESGLPANTILWIHESKTSPQPSYWIGTPNGLAHFVDGKFRIYTKESGLPVNAINSVIETKTGNSTTIWVGTAGGGLASIDKSQIDRGRWTIYDVKSGLPFNFVGALYETVEDGRSVVWAGTSYGLVRVADKRLTVLDTKDGLPSKAISCLLETRADDGSTIFWVGTQAGLARRHNNTWTSFDKSSGLVSNEIISLKEITARDGSKHLWVGTQGGVSVINLGDPKKIVSISDADGSRPRLPNNTIYQICEDKQKNIYLFTNKGIARLTPNTPDAKLPSDYTLYCITTKDGLPSNEFTQGANIIDSRGQILGGTVAGLALLDPSKSVLDNVKKPLILEEAVALGKENDRTPILDNVLLSYNQNKLYFSYALLDYFRGRETQYQTQLSGIDIVPTAWSNQPYREFSALPAGDYLFKVWGRDYAGNISGPLEIRFTIKPFPLNTWWAYLIYAAIIAGSVYYAQQYRLSLLQKRNIELEVKVAERTEELARKNAQLEGKNHELVKINEELTASNHRADRIFSALAEALPGKVLDSKYRLDEKIDAGGFGAVFRGTHLAMKRPIAVKVFKPAPGNDSAEALERFQQEAISACRINHPNAVAVLDSGISADGIAYLVMELLEGHTLTSELKDKCLLSIKRCAEIIIPVCEVLAKADALGMIHRDIKPDNIFIHNAADGEIIKVVDFGIAKLMGAGTDEEVKDLTVTGGIIGTPIYIAPERFERKPYDGKSDVYSVGVMLYEMLCGRPPFLPGHGGFLAVMKQHLIQAPPPLKSLNPNIPDEIENLVLRTLAKEPAERPTAKALAQEVAKLFRNDVSANSRLITGSNSISDVTTINFALESQPTIQIDKIDTKIEPDTSTSTQLKNNGKG